MNVIFPITIALLATALRMAQSTSLETKFAALEKKFEDLMQNITDQRTEMVSAEVLKLYLNQEIITRNRLEKQMEGLKNAMEQLSIDTMHNTSVLQLLYEDDLQQIYEMKKAQNTLQSEVRRIAQDFAEERKELNKTVSDAVRDINQTTDALQINISSTRTDLAKVLKTTTDALLMNISSTRTELETFKTKKSDVCFTATLKSYHRPFSSQTVVYEMILMNIGKGYDNTTGIFTAPMDGNYVFTWNSMTIGDSCLINLYKNGQKSTIAAYSSMSRTTDRGSATMVESLATGDRVWLRTDSCTFLYGNPYTYFSGFKI